MSFYRSSTQAHAQSRWGIARANSFPSAPSPRTCMFGSSCVKFGCPFKHPPSRPRDCPAGDLCDEVMCLLHHPKSHQISQHNHVVESKENSRPHGLSFSDLRTSFSDLRTNMRAPRASCPAIIVPRQSRTPHRPRSNRNIVRSPMEVPSGFKVGQKVQARYLPSSTKWADATIHCIRGSAFTLQFIGFDDVCEVPLRRVRHLGNGGAHYVHTPASPRIAPPTKPPSPSSLDLQQLECLKRAAVAQEDFIVAEQIKQRIVKVKKITELQNQKQAAVGEENFMLAMQLKQQIDELEKNDASPGPTITLPHRCAPESSGEEQPSSIQVK